MLIQLVFWIKICSIILDKFILIIEKLYENSFNRIHVNDNSIILEYLPSIVYSTYLEYIYEVKCSVTNQDNIGSFDENLKGFETILYHAVLQMYSCFVYVLLSYKRFKRIK